MFFKKLPGFRRLWILIFHSPCFLAALMITTLFIQPRYPFDLASFSKRGIDTTFYLIAFLSEGLSGRTADVALPSVLGLPFLYWLRGEILGKRYYHSAIRESSRNRYALVILLYALASGMILALLSLLFSFLLSAATAWVLLKGNLHFGYIPVRVVDNWLKPFYAGLVRNGLGWAVILVRSLAFSCYAGLWPMFGAAALLWFKNLYAAAITPYMINLIFDSYCRVPLLMPTNMLRMVYFDQTPFGGIPSLLFIFSGFVFLGFILIRTGLERLEGG